jgi:hypothetical protein
VKSLVHPIFKGEDYSKEAFTLMSSLEKLLHSLPLVSKHRKNTEVHLLFLSLSLSSISVEVRILLLIVIQRAVKSLVLHPNVRYRH